MAPSLPPSQPRPAAPLSPEQWAQALRVQRMSQLLPEHSGSGFGLELRPRNVHFATQNKGEKVFILLRRHFVTNLGWIFSNVFYLAVPILLYFALKIFNQSLVDIFGLKSTVFLWVVYYTIIFTNIWRNFVDWYFNIYIVTDERVVNYEFKPFVGKEVTELDLQDIEDIKEQDSGVLASFFNYGNVSVYTAADQSIITFHYIPRPELVRDKISDLAKIVKNIRNGN